MLILQRNGGFNQHRPWASRRLAAGITTYRDVLELYFLGGVELEKRSKNDRRPDPTPRLVR
jgi:hypothetical protein